MSRSAQERFDDILTAIDRCLDYRPFLDDSESRVASRNAVVHEYFRIEPELIIDILDNQLRPRASALRARPE